MKKYFKNVIAWLLLSVFAYNSGFSFLLFEISIQMNRDLIEKYFSDADENLLLVLKITDHSSIVRKRNTEIVFEGQCYDIKRELSKNGVTYFYCIHDEKEDKLNIAYTEIVKYYSNAQGNTQKGHSFDLIKELTKDLFHDNNMGVEQNQKDKSRLFAHNDFFNSNNYFKINIPPPKRFFS